MQCQQYGDKIHRWILHSGKTYPYEEEWTTCSMKILLMLGHPSQGEHTTITTESIHHSTKLTSSMPTKCIKYEVILGTLHQQAHAPKWQCCWPMQIGSCQLINPSSDMFNVKYASHNVAISSDFNIMQNELPPNMETPMKGQIPWRGMNHVLTLLLMLGNPSQEEHIIVIDVSIHYSIILTSSLSTKCIKFEVILGTLHQ